MKRSSFTERFIPMNTISSELEKPIQRESLYSVTQKSDGTPRNLTPDWDSSWESLKLLELID
jgi:hypothetical protein